MKNRKNNFAYIDSQNLNLGIKRQGWNLDFKKFRAFLKEKYNVSVAYLFVGYMPENKELYLSLQKNGYVLIFKPTQPNETGTVKGNVDADIVLQVMLDLPHFYQAVIVTSDGDFYSLVKYLYQHRQLKTVISPYTRTCSALLKKEAGEKIIFMDNLRRALEYKNRKHRPKNKYLAGGGRSDTKDKTH